MNTLIERRDKIGRYWLTRKSSFDNFTFEDGELQFKHLASEFDLAPEGLNPERVVRLRPQLRESAGRSKAKTPRHLEGYFLVEITSAEGKVKVYIGNRNGRLQIVGVER